MTTEKWDVHIHGHIHRSSGSLFRVSLLPAPWSEREILVGAGHVSTGDNFFSSIGVESSSKILSDLHCSERNEAANNTQATNKNLKVQLPSKPLTGEFKSNIFVFRENLSSLLKISL